MNYTESVDFMIHASWFGSKKNGLENIRELLRRLGNPERELRFIHVAGTNGKGSVCAMMDSMLRQSGYRTGLYTSPYLERFPERIRVDGKEASEEAIARMATRVREEAEAMKREGFSHPTFFELVTACALLIYREEKVDAVVWETGLGGRLDATNVVMPEVTVITAIGLDHTNVLGDTVEAIAMEKAGIFKPGVPVVIYPQPFDEAYAVLLSRAKELGCPVYSAADARLVVEETGLFGQVFRMRYQGMNFGNFRLPLLGSYQPLNAATAILAAVVLDQSGVFSMNLDDMRRGIAQTRWPGRLEFISRDPVVLIDGAHNPQGAEELARYLHTLLPARDCVLVTGVMHTKDAFGIARVLARCAGDLVITEPRWEKALPARDYAQDYTGLVRGNLTICPEDEEALEKGLEIARAKGVPLVVAGSLYLAGAARTWARKKGLFRE